MSPGLETLRRRFDWHPIRGCPGRFMLQHPDDSAALLESRAAGAGAHLERHRSDAAPDPVLVVPIENGGLIGCGLIGHGKLEGRTLWFLNDADGFARKLAQLGIVAPLPRN